MKIGILTFHRCINYGSYWQARCLADALREKGHDVFILDHCSRRVDFAEWKCALQPVLPTPVPVTDYPLYRQKIEKFFDAFKMFPLSQPFPLEHPGQMDCYDLVIVGSDEVWNLSHPWYGYYPVFYGDGIKSNKLISYAASFGNYDVTWTPDQHWLSKLHRFDRISVRDSNSQTIIKNVLGFEAPIVLDPCLQFPVKTAKRERMIDEPYVAVYGHNFSANFADSAQQYAHKNKLRLISIGYRNNWAGEQWLTAGPLEFATFMEQSQAVVTNFFHGCIFALNNSKPFVCETSPYRSHKIADLMERVESKKHIIFEQTTFAEFEFLLNNPLSMAIQEKVALHRTYSDCFLNECLALKPENSYERV